jgi:parallel beta-helix repeat protein
VFINNYVKDALDGFFFEISKGAICAGNTFVNCDHGIRVLNSTNVQVYHNTLVNSTASFERTERSAVNDHFGWHPSTGPDVDQREGHVFVGNLLVATEGFNRPLLQCLQTKVLCGRLTRPQLAQLDDNIYIRKGTASGLPLIVWSPLEGENCTTRFLSPEELHRSLPEFEEHSRYFKDDYGFGFKSPELGNYQLYQALPGLNAADSLPTKIRELLDWSKQDARTPGAYPFHP